MSRRPIAVGALAAAATLAFATPPVPGSELLAPGATTAAASLVADAGDSVYVASGEHAVFMGTAFGGSGEYTDFHWSGSGEELAFLDETNPTAVVDTSKLEPGTYTARVDVTDSTGTTATDQVRFEVAGGDGGRTEELDRQTVTDVQPGTFAANADLLFDLEVPDGLTQLDVAIEWTVPTNDYDLQLIDPDGVERASSGGAPPATREATGVADPVAGTWIVRAERWATVAEPSITMIAEGTSATNQAGNTQPTVDAGGPYDFIAGEQQVLTGTLTGDLAHVGWDLDLDGAVDVDGESVVVDLPVGRHLASLKAVDTRGFERREMVTVNVGADAAHLRELAVPFTVIGIADSGINPYHAEFSAGTYPDPEVLEATRNFTRHPSEYIPGYPQDAPALPITTGQGYFPEQDTPLWTGNDYIDTGRLYWIPGTKIIGAIDAGGSTGATSGADSHPILDDNGHGTGSTSVSAGNRYGYCPTCLLVLVEALDEHVVADYPWVDISSNSFGAIGGVPIGLATGADEPTKAAAERGQLTFFSAGNGTGNAFATTPILTYGSSPNGADWVITVGATREDNQGAIISDGYPVHISALGDGDLPSACRTGDTGQCAFGGTSAASPYTAGAFGKILTEVRDALGDSEAGQKTAEGRSQVVARGTAIEASPFLSDGILTRDELRAVGLKTALPRGQGSGPDTTYPFPWTWEGDNSVYFEGYGSAGPAHAERAIAVLLGEMELPERAQEDDFFAQDCEHRDSLYGSYDRDGDGEADPCSEAGFARHVGAGPAENVDPSVGRFDANRDAIAGGGVLTEPLTYYLHREPRFEPDRAPVPVTEDPSTAGDPGDAFETDVCGEGDNEQFMSPQDTDTDVDVCFDNRITSIPAAFRPKGIFTATDQLAGALPAGSTVSGTIFMQSSEPAAANLELVLKATDREVGRSEAVAQPVHPGGWTQFDLELTTDRLVAPGEQLTVHLVHAGVRSWAYGYNGDAASSVTISPAAADAGNEFGVTVDEAVADAAGVSASGRVAFPDLGADPQLAGFHAQSLKVQVAVDDPTFADPTYAAVDPDAGTWSATLAAPDAGEVFVRAVRDRFPSAATRRVLDAGGDDGDDGDDGTDKPGKGGGRPEEPGNGHGPPDDPGSGNGNGGRPDEPGNGKGEGKGKAAGHGAARGGDGEVAASSVDSAAAVNAAADAGPAGTTRAVLALAALSLLALTITNLRRGLLDAMG